MVKVNHETEYVIAVLAPREKTDYRTIMSNVIRAIGVVEYQSMVQHTHFVFIHDGVTSGSTGYVIETLNKIQPSAHQFRDPKIISYRKLPLDIEMYGKSSHYHWVDEVLKLEPDLLLVFDNGQSVVDYARRGAKEAGILCDIIRTVSEKK